MNISYRHTVDQLSILQERLDEAARTIVTESQANVVKQAQVNANTGAHSKAGGSTNLIPGGHIPGTGPGPNVVTGTLRRSIKPNPPIRTSEGWTGTAGPTVIYARAIELGHPNWKSGVKYPYMGPAIQAFRNRSTEIVTSVLREFLRG